MDSGDQMWWMQHDKQEEPYKKVVGCGQSEMVDAG
jgi:hypothetical protein